MPTLSARNQLIIGLGLMALLAVTRSQHFATLHSLPGASWSVFFLAGVYLRPTWTFPLLLAEVALLDFSSVTWGGGAASCIGPAYLFLVPAYAALWLGGRWYARRHRFAWGTLAPLTAGALGGAAVCELLSSGGYYFFSGRFAEPTFAEFGARLLQLFPMYLQALAFYLGIATVAHTAFTLAANAAGRRGTQAG